jgi:chromosome segregation ATPase
MDPTQLIWIGGGATVGAAVGATGIWWHMSRKIDALRERMERSEQARNGAVERSAQAREQIAQLNKAIDELRKAHSMHRSARPSSAEERRAKAEKALDAARADEKTLVLPRPRPLVVFADTEVLEKKG